MLPPTPTRIRERLFMYNAIKVLQRALGTTACHLRLSGGIEVGIVSSAEANYSATPSRITALAPEMQSSETLVPTLSTGIYWVLVLYSTRTVRYKYSTLTWVVGTLKSQPGLHRLSTQYVRTYGV